MGICESHAVAFAAGLAKAGMRPIVDIYSTFMQRAYDQIFQEVALQNLRSPCCWTAPAWSAPTARRITACSTAYLRPLPTWR